MTSNVRNLHIASKAYVRNINGNKGNAVAYNLKAFADNYGNLSVIVNREMTDITDITI